MEIIGVLFTLNEEEAISQVIKGLKWSGIKKILVVDGHSIDRTVPIAMEMGAEIIMQEGKGKGAAFQTFLKKHPINKKDFYVMLDADMSYDPKDITKFSKMLEKFEVVAGHRCSVRYTLKNFLYYLGNKLISLIAFFAKWGWNPDICTGYWGFRGSVLKKLKIKSNGFDLEADLYTEVKRMGLSFKKIKIKYYPRIGKRKLRWTDAMIIIKRILFKRFE